MSRLTAELNNFVNNVFWIYAKSYAKTWPHEYIVRENVDNDLFVKLVNHIRQHGYVGKFYSKEITYFNECGLVYWTMGAPIEETIIINRCQKEQTHEAMDSPFCQRSHISIFWLSE